MYPYPESVTPAVRSHLDAQAAFLNGLVQTISGSLQQVFQLNMQLGHTLLEETTSTAQRMLAIHGPADAMAAAAGAPPATDKLRSYQQQLSQLAATTQVDLSRVTEQHGRETSRTARALADEVSRVAVEQSGKRLRQQEDTMNTSREAFQQEAERGMRAGAQVLGSLQGGNMQGGNAQAGKECTAPTR